MSSYLRDILTDLKLAKPGLGWYECTRHTMASHFVMSGGSLETLRRILGHSTVLVTDAIAISGLATSTSRTGIGSQRTSVPERGNWLTNWLTRLFWRDQERGLKWRNLKKFAGVAKW